MSERETVSAKLYKLEDDELVKHELEMALMDEDDHWEYWEYMYENNLHRLDGNLWKVYEVKDFDYSDFVDVSKCTESELHFTASWYNGGCGFGEIVEEAFKKGVK